MGARASTFEESFDASRNEHAETAAQIMKEKYELESKMAETNVSFLPTTSSDCWRLNWRSPQKRIEDILQDNQGDELKEGVRELFEGLRVTREVLGKSLEKLQALLPPPALSPVLAPTPSPVTREWCDQIHFLLSSLETALRGQLLLKSYNTHLDQRNAKLRACNEKLRKHIEEMEALLAETRSISESFETDRQEIKAMTDTLRDLNVGYHRLSVCVCNSHAHPTFSGNTYARAHRDGRRKTKRGGQRAIGRSESESCGIAKTLFESHVWVSFRRQCGIIELWRGLCRFEGSRRPHHRPRRRRRGYGVHQIRSHRGTADAIRPGCCHSVAN